MRKIAVVGLGKFGRSVARELTSKGVEVLAIDINSRKIEEMKDQVTLAVGLKSIDEEALKEIGAHKVDAAVVCIGEDVESNLLTTLLLKKIGVKRILSRAISPLQEEILRSLEVSNILNLEEEQGRVVASLLSSVNIARRIPLFPGHSIAEVVLPVGLEGTTIKKMKAREKHGLNIIAVKRKKPAINEHGVRIYEEEIYDVPAPELKLEPEDILLIEGADEAIERFAR